MQPAQARRSVGGLAVAAYRGAVIAPGGEDGAYLLERISLAGRLLMRLGQQIHRSAMCSHPDHSEC